VAFTNEVSQLWGKSFLILSINRIGDKNPYLVEIKTFGKIKVKFYGCRIIFDPAVNVMPGSGYISRSIVETPDQGRISDPGKIKSGNFIFRTGASCHNQDAENERLKNTVFHMLAGLSPL
jgi:hypothetical protein